jgi:cobalt-zinc-cadmium efflux system membrane fusion protein
MKSIVFVSLFALLGVAGAVTLAGCDLDSERGAPSSSANDIEMCPEHGIAEADCPWCHPSLIETMGMCGGHGVPEALCSRCNPDLIAGFKAANDWCAGHDLPESQCLLCNPELAEKGAVTASDAPPSAIRVVLAEDLPRGRRPPSVVCQTDSLRVQLLSDDVAEKAGLQTALVRKRSISETISCNAELGYDGNRYAHLASRTPGVVSAVRKDLGEKVEEGDVLAIMDSAELGATKAEVLQAEAVVVLRERNHAREQELQKHRVATERSLIEAETLLAESRISLARSRQRLTSLGISDEGIREIVASQDTSSFLPLAAPFAGIVVQRHAVVGEVVDTMRPLFTIADTSRLWVMLNVQIEDLPRVRLGQPVVLEMEGLPGERRGGNITWISGHVDRRTRTLEARAEIENADGFLRAGLFGRAIVTVRDRTPALLVPKDAVQWEGCCNVVFVRRTPTLFEPRKVRLGYETDGHYVVEEGLEEGEVVVTAGSFLLKTEIMKESIGAGCCEVEPGRN